MQQVHEAGGGGHPRCSTSPGSVCSVRSACTGYSSFATGVMGMWGDGAPSHRHDLLFDLFLVRSAAVHAHEDEHPDACAALRGVEWSGRCEERHCPCAVSHNTGAAWPVPVAKGCWVARRCWPLICEFRSLSITPLLMNGRVGPVQAMQRAEAARVSRPPGDHMALRACAQRQHLQVRLPQRGNPCTSLALPARWCVPMVGGCTSGDASPTAVQFGFTHEG